MTISTEMINVEALLHKIFFHLTFTAPSHKRYVCFVKKDKLIDHIRN